jgi:hypothetical protein
MQMHIKTGIRSCFILLFAFSCQFNNNTSTNETVVHVWYGLNQTFGEPGNAQGQINILGNISCATNCKAWFLLNKDTTKHYLTLGSDLHRLAIQGDFNIEIEREALKEGTNNVQLLVAIDGKILAKEEINVHYKNNKWPLPYQVNWAEVKNIQDAVQVVDGHWMLTANGIRTQNMYYDRIIAFGDESWENYEVETTVIFHDFVVPQPGPPTYNVSHAAIATLWPGHDTDNLQPNRKWFPLGATSEFRLTSAYDSCRWRIFDGEHLYAEQQAKYYRHIIPNKKYGMKHKVETIETGKILYAVKLWPLDKQEPQEWDFTAVETSGKEQKGSACLIAHNTDVTFGNIVVRKIHSMNK